MSDLLSLDAINSLQHPLIAHFCGGDKWEVYDIDVETGLMRVVVCGPTQVMHFSDVLYLEDGNGTKHDTDYMYLEEGVWMSDGSGCNHERLVKSFKVTKSLECEQCGKIELRILRGKVDDLDADKSGLLEIISDLQDEIADRDGELESLKSFCQSEIKKMPPEYVKGKALKVDDE